MVRGRKQVLVGQKWLLLRFTQGKYGLRGGQEILMGLYKKTMEIMVFILDGIS